MLSNKFEVKLLRSFPGAPRKDKDGNYIKYPVLAVESNTTEINLGEEMTEEKFLDEDDQYTKGRDRVESADITYFLIPKLKKGFIWVEAYRTAYLW